MCTWYVIQFQIIQVKMNILFYEFLSQTHFILYYNVLSES